MKKFLFLLLLPSFSYAQNIPDTTVAKIDSIFKSYTSSTPGCAIAIIQNGNIVFQKGYGRANLEYNVSISPETIFHIASESKQYVAFCMLLLEKEGKLSLDDDIRKYLDYVPDFGKKITIQNLIYHTSGLRDQWQLLVNAGWQMDDVIKQDHVVKLISKQKALNFNPGDEWMYCNTGYTLMAEIVKKVSGLTLREYADKNIFKPLGMNNTHFHDNYQEIVPNRAYSYIPLGKDRFQHAVLSYSTVGATSLFTTVVDETKWLNNYETGQVGGKKLIEKMYKTAVLNNGTKLKYAFALNIDQHNGWQEIGHGGGDAGFRTYACRFPEKKLGVVVFANSGWVNPYDLANQVADLIIGKNSTTEPKEDFIKDSIWLKKLQGKYYSERGDDLDLRFEKGKLVARNRFSGKPDDFDLVKEGDERFRISDNQVLIVDKKNQGSDSVMQFRIDNTNNIVSYNRQPRTTPKSFTEYAGTYYDPEIEAYYYITEKDGKLSVEHRKFPTVSLNYFAPDQFTDANWWMNHLKFIRDKQGKIVAFEVNSGRIMHLRYDKVK